MNTRVASESFSRLIYTLNFVDLLLQQRRDVVCQSTCTKERCGTIDLANQKRASRHGALFSSLVDPFLEMVVLVPTYTITSVTPGILVSIVTLRI